MKYGFVFPLKDARTVAQLAVEAENAGWDAIFVADCVWGVDPWIALTAAAMTTQRIRLGTMITPISRRRPWNLAAQTATLDQLSNGRVILSVGLGAIDTGFANFGEATDRKKRAELLDEGLDIITGLWRGQPFNYDGKHYHVKETTFFPPPPPVQSPRIPIWVVGAWPRHKSMARVMRYDGLLPNNLNEGGKIVPITADAVRAMKAYLTERRQLTTPFDIVVEGRTSGQDRAEIDTQIVPLVEAGITWWLEAMWTEPNETADILARLRLGPPHID